MSRQLLLYYHYQLRSHQNISTKCYACWYYQVRNFINILKQLIGKLFLKCENRIISERIFIKPQIGCSTYRQEPQNVSKHLGGYHRLLLNNTGKLETQWECTHIKWKESELCIFLCQKPKNGFLIWSKYNQSTCSWA